MSSRWPSTVRLSMAAFARRGGLEGPHKDGWGLAWYDGPDVRLLKEPRAASDSAWVRFVQETPFESGLVVSHIRKALQGGVSSANTQPFVRELGGRLHVFAHNGNLDPAGLRERLPHDSFSPVGTTDSEHAFCALMSMLRRLERKGERPSWAERLDVFSGFAQAARELGPANFVLADGEFVFIHADRRTQKDGTISPPGLHLLQRHCAEPGHGFEAEGLSLHAPAQQQVLLAASVPLTDEAGWRPLPQGTILVARAGEVLHEAVARH